MYTWYRALVALNPSVKLIYKILESRNFPKPKSLEKILHCLKTSKIFPPKNPKWNLNPKKQFWENYKRVSVASQGRRQRGGQWCPAAPFHLWPPGCCIYPILYLKNVPPLLVFVPPLLLNPSDGPVASWSQKSLGLLMGLLI